MVNKKTVFIGGGNMAEGIIRGLINTETMAAENITVSEIVEARRSYLSEKYGVNVTDEPSNALKEAEVVIFAVRPQVAASVFAANKAYLNDSQLIGSIIASLPVADMEEMLGSDKHIVRIMPNVLIEARAGYSALKANANVTEEDKKTIEEMFNAIGSTMYITEDMFNAFTCFSDAGAAYFAYFLSGMIDAGVRAGFSRPQARAMAIDNMIGTAKQIDISGMHPMQLTDTMTSPAGVTIEATYTMDKLGLKGVVMDAVNAAIKHGEEM